jgi:hypothetical protein
MSPALAWRTRQGVGVGASTRGLAGLAAAAGLQGLSIWKQLLVLAVAAAGGTMATGLRGTAPAGQAAICGADGHNVV